MAAFTSDWVELVQLVISMEVVDKYGCRTRNITQALCCLHQCWVVFFPNVAKIP